MLAELFASSGLGASALALVAVTFLGGGVIKGALGLGLPVVVLAVLAPTLGLQAALALFLAPGLVSNVWQAVSGPYLRSVAARLWPFLAAAMVGIALGVQVLAGEDTRALEALLGVLLMVYSAVSLATPQIPPPGRREPWMGPLAGGLGGVMFGMTGVFIVPGILYVQALGMERDRLVQALGLIFLTISGTLAVAMGSHGLVTPGLFVVSLAAIPFVLLGFLIGQRLRRYISEDSFRRLFFVGLIGASLFTVWRSLFA
ncbi:MAG: sulfite exporter TauE/SafE family protein [Pseudomonadota bacterium]